MAANAILEADIFKSTYLYPPSMIMLLQHIHCCLIVFTARNISIFMYSNKWAQLNVFINFDLSDSAMEGAVKGPLHVSIAAVIKTKLFQIFYI